MRYWKKRKRTKTNSLIEIELLVGAKYVNYA